MESEKFNSGITIIFLSLGLVLVAAVICFLVIRSRRMKKTEETVSKSVEDVKDKKEGHYGNEEYTYYDRIRSASYVNGEYTSFDSHKSMSYV